MSFDFLKQKYGLDQNPHSGRSLWDHLEGVYHTLKKWDESETVCTAGHFHSIYGTEIYKNVSVDFSKRKEVADHIGEEAEHLAYLFSVIDRSSVWKNCDRRLLTEYKVWNRVEEKEIILSKKEMQNYFSIFLANLIEQRPFEKERKNAYVSELLRAKDFINDKAWNEFLKIYNLV